MWTAERFAAEYPMSRGTIEMHMAEHSERVTLTYDCAYLGLPSGAQSLITGRNTGWSEFRSEDAVRAVIREYVE